MSCQPLGSPASGKWPLLIRSGGFSKALAHPPQFALVLVLPTALKQSTATVLSSSGLFWMILHSEMAQMLLLSLPTNKMGLYMSCPCGLGHPAMVLQIGG